MNTPTLRSSTATEKASVGFAYQFWHRRISVRAPGPRSHTWYSACTFQARSRRRARTRAYREIVFPEVFRKARVRNRDIQSAPQAAAAEFVVQGLANPQAEGSRVLGSWPPRPWVPRAR